MFSTNDYDNYQGKNCGCRKPGNRNYKGFHTRRPGKPAIHAELINKNDYALPTRFEGEYTPVEDLGYDGIEYDNFLGFGKKARARKKEKRELRKAKKLSKVELRNAKAYATRTLADQGIQFKSGAASIAEGIGGLAKNIFGGGGGGGTDVSNSPVFEPTAGPTPPPTIGQESNFARTTADTTAGGYYPGIDYNTAAPSQGKKPNTGMIIGIVAAVIIVIIVVMIMAFKKKS